MPHVNAQQAKQDCEEKLDKWMVDCVKKGGRGHETTHGATNTFGTGYIGASETDPATILESEWTTLLSWWSKLMLDVPYKKWDTGSLGGVTGVRDLCCSCEVCPKVEKRDFNSPTGKSLKLRTFVYHLKVVKVAPIVASPPVSKPPTVASPQLVAVPQPVVESKVAAPVTVAMQASSNSTDDSLLLDYKIEAKGKIFTGKLDKDGKAEVDLPAGTKISECKFGFQGGQGTSMETGKSYLLPGGRYMIKLSIV